MIRHIERLWITYQHDLLEGAPPLQIQETRRAFYAGAYSLLQQLGLEASPGDEVTDSDEQIIEDVYDEMQEFLRDVTAGRK